MSDALAHAALHNGDDAVQLGSKPRIALLDYGAGNLRSVQRALERAGAIVDVTTEPGGDALVIPGVGAFADAKARLAPVWDALSSWVLAGKPTLGICLGFQLLFEASHEHGTHAGLGAFRGVVERLPDTVTVPHMGWQRIAGLGDPAVYFAHSYGVRAGPFATATVEHGRTWTAAVQRDRVWGFQFHPEKSSDDGIELLRRFLREAVPARSDVVTTDSTRTA